MTLIIRFFTAASIAAVALIAASAALLSAEQAFGQTTNSFLCSQCPDKCCTNNGAFCVGTGGCPSGCVGCTCFKKNGVSMCS